MWSPEREFPVDAAAVQDAYPSVSCDPLALDETVRAVHQLKSGKPGRCGIYAGMLKAGGAAGLLWLHTLLYSIWNTGIIPTDWRPGVVLLIWKGKGDTHECKKYRGLQSSLYQAKSWHEFFSKGFAKSCQLIRAMSRLVSHPRSLL